MPRTTQPGRPCLTKSQIKEGLRIFYTNADQLPNKLTELKFRAEEEKPHIIIVTEVNNKNNKANPDPVIFNIDGYQMHQQNVSLKGRGIIIYTHQSISKILDISAKTEFSEYKLISIKIDKTTDFLVGAIYRSDSGTGANNENLLNLLKEINEMKQSHKLIVGDFNYKDIDWESWSTTKSETSDEQAFITCIQDLYWYQHVMLPTRYREGNNPSTLDLVFTNEESMIEHISYQSPLGKSDHSLLYLKFLLKQATNFQPRTVYMYDKGNYPKMNEDLKIDWQTQLSNDNDVHTQWESIKKRIMSATQKHIPSYQTTEDNLWKKGKIPLKPETRKQIRKKHRLWQRAYETRQEEKTKKWKEQRNKVNKLIKEAEEKLEIDIAKDCKINPKKLWKYVKSQTKVKPSMSPLHNRTTGKLTANEKEQADVLAQQFASVMVDEPDGDIPRLPAKVLKTLPLSKINITEEMVLKKLNALNPTKSPGPDGIHPRVLKETAVSIAPALVTLYNNILKSHDIPEDWRSAIITALFKKGDKTDPGNYRPVSLTCIACKIMESIVYDHIVKHMIENNLFSNKQYGFISKRSAALQLLNVLEIWSSILDEDGIIDNINMDFQKAFDSVPHRRLLGKLISYGIEGDIILFIEAFLKNRKQKVIINGQSSNNTEVISGVPQGSVIAALLFVIYINDMPDNIKSHLFLFADDCKFFRQILTTEDTEIMQQDLDKLHEWSEKWLLKFHPDKCVNLRIQLKNQRNPHTYHLGRNNLANVEEVKDLGVIVDAKMKFEKHMSTKVNKANQMWGIMKRTFKHMNKQIFKKLFSAHVRSHLEYAVQFWCPYLRKDINQIESVQRRATKSVPGLKDLSYKERLQELDMPTLAFRRLRGSMIEVYKLLNTYDKDVATKLPIKETSTRGHNLKIFATTAKKLHPKHHSFHNRIANPWNSLPAEVVNSPTLNTFKSRLDRHWNSLPLKFDHEARDFQS